MPVHAVKTGVASTYHAANEIIACGPTQAITSTQRTRKKFWYTRRAFLYIYIFHIVPVMQSKGEEL